MFNAMAAFLVAGYVFVSAIPHTPAARYFFLGALVILTIIGITQKRFTIAFKNPIVSGLFLFVFAALLSSFCSPYLIDSLQAFRKDYLPPLLVLIATTSLRQTAEEKIFLAKLILYALLAGFIFKTGLAFWDGAINNPFIFSPYGTSDPIDLPKYVSYYAVESTVYLTIAYSTLIFLTKKWIARLTLLTICSTSFFIVLASGVRSTLLATCAGLFFATLFKLGNFKRVTIFVTTTLLIIVAALFIGRHEPNMARYVTLLNPDSYSKKEGMSGRYPIWQGVSELIVERPFFGFGPGWQKLPEAAADTGLLQKWEADSSPYGVIKSQYFSLERGKANPHNLFLQILFETGVLGLLFYICFLVSLQLSSINICPSGKDAGLMLWQKYTITCYIIAYFFIDITNALLLHNTLVSLAIISVLIVSAENKKT